MLVPLAGGVILGATWIKYHNSRSAGHVLVVCLTKFHNVHGGGI